MAAPTGTTRWLERDDPAPAEGRRGDRMRIAIARELMGRESKGVGTMKTFL
jgi:hypothetical protein